MLHQISSTSTQPQNQNHRRQTSSYRAVRYRGFCRSGVSPRKFFVGAGSPANASPDIQHKHTTTESKASQASQLLQSKAKTTPRKCLTHTKPVGAGSPANASPDIQHKHKTTESKAFAGKPAPTGPCDTNALCRNGAPPRCGPRGVVRGCIVNYNVIH